MDAQTVLADAFRTLPDWAILELVCHRLGVRPCEHDGADGEDLVGILPAWLPPFSHQVHTPPIVVEIRFLFTVLGPPARPRSRDSMRSKRKRHVRPSTLSIARVQKHKLAQWREDEPDDGRRRLPLTRDECRKGERPCGYISCKWHLFIDVDPKQGSIKFNFPDLFNADGTPRLEDMAETCALDVRDHGGDTLEAVATLMNITRERIRQIVKTALRKLRGTPAYREIAELFGLRLDRGEIDITDESIDAFGTAGKTHVNECDPDELDSEDEP